MGWLSEFADTELGKTVITVSGTLLVVTFGVFLGTLKDLFLDHWKRRRLTKYHAMLVASQLDQLIADCLEVLDDPKFEDKEGTFRGTVADPVLEWRSDIDWPSITHRLMYDCLALPPKAEAASRAAGFVAEHISGPPDYHEYFVEREYRFAEVGLEAERVLRGLINKYDVQSRSHGDRCPKDDFETAVIAGKAYWAKTAEESKSFWAQLEARCAVALGTKEL